MRSTPQLAGRDEFRAKWIDVPIGGTPTTISRIGIRFGTLTWTLLGSCFELSSSGSYYKCTITYGAKQKYDVQIANADGTTSTSRVSITPPSIVARYYIASGVFDVRIRGFAFSEQPTPSRVQLSWSGYRECAMPAYELKATEASEYFVYDGETTLYPCALVYAPEPATRTIVANELTVVQVRLRVPPSVGVDPNSLKLYDVDEFHYPLDLQCQLSDDGDSGRGDDIAGDGVYSCRFQIARPPGNVVRYAVFAIASGAAASSPTLTVKSVALPSDYDLDNSSDVIDDGYAAWSTAFSATGGDFTQTRIQTIVAMSSHPDVLRATSDRTGETIWLTLRSGQTVGLTTFRSGYRGGVPEPRVETVELTHGNEDDWFETTIPPVPPGGSVQEPALVHPLRNKSVLFGTPFESMYPGPTYDLLNDSACPSFEIAPPVSGTAANVASVLSFPSYGIGD
jgi:hypothetical protein